MDRKDNSVVWSVLQLLNQILNNGEMRNQHLTILQLQQQKTPQQSCARKFLEWLTTVEGGSSSTSPDTQSSDTSSLATSGVLQLGSFEQPPVSSLITLQEERLIPTTNNQNQNTKSNNSETIQIRSEVLRLMKILATTDDGAKYMLGLCLVVVKDSPSTDVIADLFLRMINNERLALFFLSDLSGYAFLANEIEHSSSSVPAFLLPAFKVIRTNLGSFMSSSSRSSQAASRAFLKENPGLIENLNSFCEPVGSDTNLNRLLKESQNLSSESQTNWIAQFKTDDRDVSINISFSNACLLREVHIQALQNVKVGGSVSHLPSIVIIEGGNSPTRLSLLGRFVCSTSTSGNSSTSHSSHSSHSTSSSSSSSSSNSSSSSMSSTSVSSSSSNSNSGNQSGSSVSPLVGGNQQTQSSPFKFRLAAGEVVKYIRLTFARPERGSVIALGKLQMLGSTFANFGPITSLVGNVQLPFITSLQLLSHCLLFGAPQKLLSSHILTQTVVFSLLKRLSTQTFPFISHILLSLAKHNGSLADLVLNELLIDSPSTFHATLAGNLCAQGKKNEKRMIRLRDYVFKQLKNSPSLLTSFLTPFISALSFAISVADVSLMVKREELSLLIKCAANSLDGSLLRTACLTLLSGLIRSNSKYFSEVLEECMAAGDVESLLTTNRNLLNILGSLSSASPECATFVLSSSIPEKLRTFFRSLLEGGNTDVLSSNHSDSLIHSETAPKTPSHESKASETLSPGSETNKLNTSTSTSTTTNSNPTTTVSLFQPSSDPSRTSMMSTASSGLLKLHPLQQQTVETILSFFNAIAHESSTKSWIGAKLFDELFELCGRSEFNSRLLYAALNVFRSTSNLHQQNQERIAENLLENVKDAPADPIISQLAQISNSNNPDSLPQIPQLNEILLQLLVEIFSFEERISIAMHSENTTATVAEELLLQNISKSMLVKRLEPMKVNLAFCHSSLDIDENSRTVTASDRMKYVWRTSLGSRLMKSGVHKWEVFIEKTTNTCNIMVGVCEVHQHLQQYPGASDAASGWSYYGCSPGNE